MPHTTVADAGGMAYLLMKVNVWLYPWSLINGNTLERTLGSALSP